jgi:hypothetical protein
MTLGRCTLAATLIAALALIAAQAAGADDPSTATLAGEEMLVQDVTLTTVDCDPTQVSTVGYTATGVATGPYPGTFTVQGTVTIEPQTLVGGRPGTVAGPLQSLTETFTIDSALGTVTGTKTLAAGAGPPSDQGTCQEVTGFSFDPVANATGTVVDISSEPTYDAIVHDANGTSHVTGDALLNVTEIDLDGMCMLVQCHFRQASFDQFFLTSTAIDCDDDTNGQGDEGVCDEN